VKFYCILTYRLGLPSFRRVFNLQYCKTEI